MLSAFESALLDRHLRGCPSCRSFSVAASRQTSLLRDAPLEELEHRVLVPSSPHVVRRRVAGALGACVVAVGAAFVLILPGGRQSQETGALRAPGHSAAPALVVFAASPTATNANVEVPRLRVKPASFADGPVHGYYSEPV